LVGGAVLFFLIFAAIFVGSWALLLVFLFSYAAAGVLGVWVGGATPVSLALVLAAPAMPWVLWVFPGAAAEAGLLRALLWPGLVVVAGALGWLGGEAAAVVRTRKVRQSRAA
jgi:hypothetical protein